MKIRKAEGLDDVYNAFNSKPIEKEQLAEFYMKTAQARSGNPRNRLARLLRKTPDTNEHFLFVGYRGCGKSTELNHLQKDLENDFLVINFSVQQELDPVNLNYIELFIVTMERLFHFAHELQLPISKQYLKNIQTWITSKEIQEISDNYMGAEASVGAKAEIGIPAILQFFTSFKASAKSSRQLKEVLKQNVEPKLSVLIGHCNDLIREIKLKLDTLGKKDLLIILEDLDKIPLDRANKLFINYTSQLTQLETNVIYTFPIALYYSTYFNDIKAYFAQPSFELPMIKVSNKDGSDNEEGIATMRRIVAARVNIANVFEDEVLLRKMILKSGGVLRDLFMLINEAANQALDFEREKINEKDYTAAYHQLKREYDNNLSFRDEGDKHYKPEDYYEALIKLYNDTEKKPDNSVEVMHLRQNLCILGYNGEGWCNLHPLILDALKDRKLIPA
ncbi:MAG: hypothetical protein AAGJ93_02290 [Bacteroidota bacterium]